MKVVGRSLISAVSEAASIKRDAGRDAGEGIEAGAVIVWEVVDLRASPGPEAASGPRDADMNDGTGIEVGAVPEGVSVRIGARIDCVDGSETGAGKVGGTGRLGAVANLPALPEAASEI